MEKASQSGYGARPFTSMGISERNSLLMALFARLSMYWDRALAVLDVPLRLYQK